MIQNKPTRSILPAHVQSHVKPPTRRNNTIVVINVAMKAIATDENSLYGAGLKKRTFD
jgi:hypothetical protein